MGLVITWEAKEVNLEGGDILLWKGGKVWMGSTGSAHELLLIQSLWLAT
jgi:hypothetical protein